MISDIILKKQRNGGAQILIKNEIQVANIKLKRGNRHHIFTTLNWKLGFNKEEIYAVLYLILKPLWFVLGKLLRFESRKKFFYKNT